MNTPYSKKTPSIQIQKKSIGPHFVRSSEAEPKYPREGQTLWVVRLVWESSASELTVGGTLSIGGYFEGMSSSKSVPDATCNKGKFELR